MEVLLVLSTLSFVVVISIDTAQKRRRYLKSGKQE